MTSRSSGSHRGQVPSLRAWSEFVAAARTPPGPTRRDTTKGAVRISGRRPVGRAVLRAGDEADPALVGLGDLDVGDPVDGDDDATTPFVDQGQQAVLGPAGHGRGHVLLDL